MRAAPVAASLLLIVFGSLVACGPVPDNGALQKTHNFEGPHGLRVVTLAPHLAELTFAAGAGQFVVGVSAYSDYPAEVSDRPVIGDAFVVDQEQLALLKPDMLLAWESGTPKHVVDELSKRGYRVEVIRTRSLDDIGRAIEKIGDLAGTADMAGRAAEDFRTRLRTLQKRFNAAAPIRVFYQIQKRPLYTISGEHYVSELIAACSGQNIFSDLGSLAPLVAVEAVIERNPEVLLISSDSEADALSEWDRWPDLDANRYGNRFVMPANEIGRPTPRLLIAAEALCNALHEGRSNRDSYTLQ